MRFLDILATIVVLALLGAMIAFPLLGADTGDELRTAFGIAIGWVFRSGANGVNGYLERKKNDG